LTERARARAATLVLTLFPPALSFAVFRYTVLAFPKPLFSYLFTDPDFAYYDGAALLAHGHAPWYFDHPGTPVMAANAALHRVRFLLTSGETSLARDLVVNYLGYHRAGLWLAFLLLAFSQVFLVRRLSRRGASLPFAALAAAAPLFFPTVIESFAHLSSEIWLAAGSLFLVAALWQVPGEDGENHAARGIAAGAVLGILLSVKLVAAPLALLLLRLRGRRSQWASVIAAAAMFAVGTAPIWGSYPQLGRWIWNLASRSGRYGAEPGILPGAALLFTGLRGLFSSVLVFPLFLLAATSIWLKRASSTWPWPELLAALALVALAVRSQFEERYLLPLAAPLALVTLRAQFLPRSGRIFHGGAVLAIIAGTLALRAPPLAAERTADVREAEEIQAKLDGLYANCAVELLSPAPVPASPFLFDLGHDAELEAAGKALFPRYFAVLPGRGTLEHFGEASSGAARFPCRVRVEDLRGKGDPVLVRQANGGRNFRIAP
jgi:hypothetical protein